MRPLRLFIAALTLLGVQLAAANARAQAVTILANIEWNNEASRGDRDSKQINRADCLANAEVTLSTQVTLGDGSFEVWVGSACTELMSRTDHQCFLVKELEITDTQDVTLRVQDLLQTPSATAAADAGTDAVCDGSDNQSGGIDLHVFFMLLNGGDGMLIGTPADMVFNYDITPPPPPTGVTAGPGEEAVEVTFTAPESTQDLAGYRFFCSDVGASPEPGAGGAGEPAAAPAGDCTSSVLVAGEDPPTEAVYACGSANSAQADHGTATGRSNGERSVVAVASLDEFGNLGKLSALVCSTPKEITGYFEAYRAAGGQGGGGFCGFAPPRRGALAAGLVLLLGGLALLRRRP